MAGYAREPRAYELMVILLPELADDDLSGAMDRVSKYITDQQGAIKEILTDSPWGRRRLAYTIRFNGQDYRDGYYAIWHFDLVPSNMNDIERELKLDTRVIRYLMVHDDPKWGSPNDGNQPDGAATEESAATVPDRSGSRRPAAPAAEAVATAVVAEAVAEEAVTEAVVAEAVAEEAVAEAVVAEAIVEEAVVEGASDDVVAEAVAEEVLADVVAEEAVAEAVVAEAVAEEAVAEEVVAEAAAEEAASEAEDKQ